VLSERLRVEFPGRKRVHVRIRDHEIGTDQSVKAGGEASAPEPFDLFLASIGACAGVYALNFCQSRGLPTDGLGLTMDWERDPAAPLRARVRYRLRLPPGFPARYRPGILRAIDLCAVKKHILNPPEFVTEIVE
jgi:ribosomal protein S12 methylthiotransferase accessory factor